MLSLPIQAFHQSELVHSFSLIILKVLDTTLSRKALPQSLAFAVVDGSNYKQETTFLGLYLFN